jgi:hypothetical protein
MFEGSVIYFSKRCIYKTTMLPVIHVSIQLPNSTGTFVYLGLEYLEAHNYPLPYSGI